MDFVAGDGQRIVAGVKVPSMLADPREPWDITADYIRSEDISVCPTCRQYETMEIAIGGNGFSEYRCSNCGAQVRYEED